MGGNGGFLTPKAIANRIKSKGLQKLRWYCQMCEKQCRDENGFKCHCTSEAHLRKMMVFSQNPDKFLNSYSTEFKDEFMKLLSRRYGTRRVHANLVYQEYISDRTHLHMNATQWTSLTEFVKYLGREGLCEVDETEKGWFIKWVDRRPESLAKQEAVLKKERMERTEEERAQKELEEQIRKTQELSAAAAASDSANDDNTAGQLKRDNNEEPIKLELKLNTSFMAKPKIEPKKFNALALASKKGLGASSIPSTKSSSPFSNPLSSAKSSGKKPSAVEQIIHDEQARKRKSAEYQRSDDKRRRL
ncbi:domain of Kin17 curved DNA-binding protein-domain-containing protein [Gaertneriomyces semiglobifer]|nr:domain of Kin17 curved DNA-binding protein-domain-containing protein [Gaertneriomyces semiglobifer]